MMRYSICCLLAALSLTSAAIPHAQLLVDQTAPVNNKLTFAQHESGLQQRDANVTCDVRCNDVDVDSADLDLGVEAKSCVGTLTVFCKNNDIHGVFGFKCEGKSTMLADSTTISICEGAFQSFGKRGIRTPSGDYIKKVKAFGCLGTAIGVSPNKSASSDDVATLMVNGISEEDLAAMDNTLAGKETTREGRCNGLSGRFEGFKVGGKCNKHKVKGPKHGDIDADKPHRPEDVGPMDFDPDVDNFAMPGARRSLSEHHDHHDEHHEKHGKHHGEKHHGDKHHGKGEGKHHDMDSEHGSHHKDWKNADMTSFDDLEGKVQHHMHMAGVELLPRDVPSGSFGGPPKCSITCNGRPTWFGAFFPCFGKLEIDCEAGSKAPSSVAGSGLDAAKPGFAIQGSCQGFWTGALFKTCKGFSTAHVETQDRSAWDFCSGKNSVRMGGRPGKGFYSGSWCKGQYLAVVEKEEE